MNRLKRNIILVLTATFVVQGCSNTTEPTTEKSVGTADSPEITFEKLEHDFGTVKYRGDASYDFVFTNTGEDPLILERVKTSCGCTASEWTKEPVKKGENGKISVKYSATSPGSFTKSITVYSNADEPIRLIIKGTVEKAAAAEG